MAIDERIDEYRRRVDAALNKALPAHGVEPQRLHDAMRYAVFNGGKRVRPLLVYATGEVFDGASAKLDAPAAAIELIHAFSLVHDDLPAMDDDDLRRGKPTLHRAYDEATAILAADALQPLAFEILARAGERFGDAERWLGATRVIASACGSCGMTGGQAIDLASEGRSLTQTQLETMFHMKTGCLIRAAVESTCCIDPACTDDDREALLRYARALGLAFQIRDDILDVEGETRVLGKAVGADARRGKVTWPSLHGVEAAKRRCDELVAEGRTALLRFGDKAESLLFMADYMTRRVR